MTIYYPKPEILSQIPLTTHAVIEASAGTGKTYTIERLFVEILLTRDVTVENILVVTYTEKAAAELRGRVRKIVQNILECKDNGEPQTGACWEIDERVRIKLERALFSFDKAPIHTIHGFFQRVITENAFTGGRLFEQSLVDARSLFAEEFRNVLRTRIAKEDQLKRPLQDWLESGKSVEDLEKRLFTSFQKKCEIRPAYDPAAYAAEVRSVAGAFRRELDPDSIKNVCKTAKLHHSTIKAVIARIDKAQACLDAHSAGGCALDLSQDDLAKISKELKPLLPGASKVIDRLEALLVSPEAMLVQLYLPLIAAALNERKLREGLYDFDDMIGYLKQALEGPQAGALIRNLRSRYRYALIDESQDTDEVQWRIFRKIFFESGEGNRIFLIGDPKQAIYAFRGADVYTYLDARKDICGSAGPVPLDRNFRSTERLIRACNLLLDQKAAEPFFTGDQIRYDAPVTSGQPDLDAVDSRGRSLVPVTIVQAVPGGSRRKISAAQYRRQVGGFIAREIKALLGDRRIFLAKGGERAQVKAQDIFILTRAEREGRALAEHLRREQIPFAFYKQDGLFQTREAEEIRDLLAAAAEPQVRSKRLKAWMTRFFGVPISELSRCRDLPESEPLVRKLLEWHALARKRDYRRLFTRIVDESAIVRRELFLEDNERSLTNFHHIFEILLEETTHRSCDLAEVVLLLNSFIAGTGAPARDNGNIQRLETEKEAVQIMTLHKSKGLEAAVVFLYGGFGTWKDKELFTFHEGSRRIVHLGAPPQEVRDQAEQEELEEHQRLLYVGMTRAKARLYLPHIAVTPEDQRNSKDGPYNELNRRIDALRSSRNASADLFAWVTVGPEATEDGAVRGAELPAAGIPLWQPDPAVLSRQVPEAELHTLRQDHRAFGVTSYTRIKQQQEGLPDREAEDRETEQTGRVSGDGQAREKIGGPAFGSAVHSIMERISFESFSPDLSPGDWAAQEQVRAVCRESLRDNGIDLVHLPYAQELVFHTLTAPVALGQSTLPGFWTLREHARETEFLYPFPEEFHPRIDAGGRDFAIERGYVKGYIDFLFRFDGKVYFLDWKTDILPDYSTLEMEHHFLAHYEVQVKLYLLAMVKLMQCRSHDDYDRDFGGVLYCFMRGMEPSGQDGSGIYLIRPEWDEVLAWEQELIRSTGYI